MRHQHPTDREKNRAASLAAQLDPTQPLDMIPWMMRRLGAVIEREDRKGDGADGKRIDAALAAMAGMVRTAAPYRHPRIKPTDPPQKNVRQIIELRWAGTPEHRVGAPADAFKGNVA